MEEVLQYEDKIKTILGKWGIDAVFAECTEKNGYVKITGGYYYIDHSSELDTFIEEITSKEELLMAYLFSPTSYIVTGNDNCDFPFEILPRDGEEILLDFEKGN